MHTPGPWTVLPGNKPGTYVIGNLYRQEDGSIPSIGVREKFANARLIAAAPELLDAAKLALTESERADTHFKNTSPATIALRAAIARATTGE